jgi:hypothetical protein
LTNQGALKAVTEENQALKCVCEHMGGMTCEQGGSDRCTGTSGSDEDPEQDGHNEEQDGAGEPPSKDAAVKCRQDAIQQSSQQTLLCHALFLPLMPDDDKAIAITHALESACLEEPPNAAACYANPHNQYNTFRYHLTHALGRKLVDEYGKKAWFVKMVSPFSIHIPNREVLTQVRYWSA